MTKKRLGNKKTPATTKQRGKTTPVPPLPPFPSPLTTSDFDKCGRETGCLDRAASGWTMERNHETAQERAEWRRGSEEEQEAAWFTARLWALQQTVHAPLSHCLCMFHVHWFLMYMSYHVNTCCVPPFTLHPATAWDTKNPWFQTQITCRSIEKQNNEPVTLFRSLPEPKSKPLVEP